MIRPFALFLTVVICLVVVVQALGHLTWWLSAAGETSLAELRKIEPPMRSVDTVTTHSVAQWPADRERLFAQAPTLDEAVAAGTLPPVADRLPVQPLMIEPVEQHGPYGGTWRRYANSPGDAVNSLDARVFYELPFRWSADGRSIMPNVFRGWDVDESGKVYTFYLREGMRWSDGEPFSADDIAFWYEHVLTNEELTFSIPRGMRPGGTLATFEQVDTYCFRLHFAEPNSLLIERELTGHLGAAMLQPKHYLSQFHPAFFNDGPDGSLAEGELPEAIRQQMAVRGYEDWTQLFTYQNQIRNPDRPTLAAWRLVWPPPSRPVVFERNPYYWKVDDQGNQLPYIDRIEVEIYEPQIINMRAIQGQMDMQFRHLRLDNYPLLMANRQRSEGRFYRVFLWQRMSGNEFVLAPNQNHHDPILRELIQDKRFRVALSLGIDRKLINEAVFFGSGEPRQVAPSSASPFYVEGFAEASTAYDPAQANALLDELGLERGGDGVRRRPDGHPLTLRIDVTQMPNAADVAAPLVASMWSKLGIRAEVNRMNRDLFYQRKAAGMHDVAAWTGEIEENPVIDPRWFLPFNGESNHAIEYATWFRTDGTAGEMPSGALREVIQLYRQLEATPTEQDRVALMRRIVSLNKDNLWVIGTVGHTPLPVVVSEQMRNVPQVAAETWHYRTPGNTAPESYAIDEGGVGR